MNVSTNTLLSTMVAQCLGGLDGGDAHSRGTYLCSSVSDDLARHILLRAHQLAVSTGINRPDLYQEEDDLEAGPRILSTPVVFVKHGDPFEANNATIIDSAAIFNDALLSHSNSKLAEAVELYQSVVSAVSNILKRGIESPCKALLEMGMRAHNNIGVIVYAQGNSAAAESHFQESLLFSKELFDFEDLYRLEHSTIRSNWCRVCWMSGETSESLYAGLSDILQIRSSLLKWDHSDVAAAHFNLAAVEYTRLNNEKAVAHLMQYLNVAAQRIRSGQPNDLDVIPALSYLLLIQNEHADDSTSTALTRGILTLQGKQQYDEVHSSYEIANVLNGVGSLLFSKGDMEMALLFFQEELRVDEALYKDESALCISVTCHNIGRVLQELQNSEQAVIFYERALKHIYGNDIKIDYIFCKSLPADANVGMSKTNFLSTLWYNLGLLHDKLGARSKAICAFEISLELRKSLLYRDHVDIACLNFNIGVLHMEEKRPDAAFKFLSQVISVRRQYRDTTGKSLDKITDKLCIRTLQKLANMYKKQNNIQEAINTLREVLRILIHSTEFDNISRLKDMALVLRSISEHCHVLGDLTSALAAAQDCVQELDFVVSHLLSAAKENKGSLSARSEHQDQQQLATVELLLSSLLLLGSLYHEVGEPIKAQQVHQDALMLIQWTMSTTCCKGNFSCPASFRNLCEVVTILASTPFAPAA